MTTVVDPLGTPVIIYNRSGVAIVEIEAANSPVEVVPRVCGHMVVLVTTTQSSSHVQLPSDAEIGDVVEVHLVNETHVKVFMDTPSGESIIFTGEVHHGTGCLFRKLSSTLWGRVGKPG